MNSVTLAIPAYNEEKNIVLLLKSLLSQKRTIYKLNKIVVSSDGSTDRTVEVARSIGSPLVTVIDNKDRRGLSRGLNQVISKCTSDIIVTIDADIQIKSTNFLNELVRPIVELGADLTSSTIKYLPGSNFVHQTLATGTILKEMLFDSLSTQDNIYHCFGLARAFSKSLYNGMSLPSSIGNDMYTYLYCKSKDKKFVYNPKAIAWYKLPSTLKDYQSQSRRFLVSGSEMVLSFNKTFVQSELNIPFINLLKATKKSIWIILTKPVHCLAYFVLQIYSHITKHEEVRQAWDIAESSK